MEKLAPVLLFTYNRLDHTRQTVEALQRNVYADNTEVFVYSDAPKNEAAEDSVRAVRKYLHGVAGFKRVEIIERTENWGLARNIIDGVTNIVNEYGKVIVLEDDIVTSKYFLKYMNDALRIYCNEGKVQLISGYSYIPNDCRRVDAYFLPFTSCWGWATWKRVWRGFKRNPAELVKKYTKEEIKRFNLDGAHDFWSQVQMNADGRLFTWAIFLYELVYRNHGLCLYPPISLADNIGFDDSGEHCSKDNSNELVRMNEEYEIEKFPSLIEVDLPLYQLAKNRFISLRPPIWKRFIIKVSRFMKVIIRSYNGTK